MNTIYWLILFSLEAFHKSCILINLIYTHFYMKKWNEIKIRRNNNENKYWYTVELYFIPVWWILIFNFKFKFLCLKLWLIIFKLKYAYNNNKWSNNNKKA